MPRIPLPSVTRTRSDAAHPFPFQIGHQTLEFLHGAIFYATVTDLATGAFLREGNGKERLERYMEANGLDPGAHQSGWAILQKYRQVFGPSPFQSVLVSMCSHWDWYVRRLCEFVRAGREFERSAPMSKALESSFRRADRLPFDEQIPVLSSAADVAFPGADECISELYEMTLVRNIGLHNRWEIDAKYLGESSCTRFMVGEIRDVTASELHSWQALLIKLIQCTSTTLAMRYRALPEDAI